MVPQNAPQPKSYVDLFLSLIESADDRTGKINYTLPKETMEKLEQLCRIELGKELDGSDITEPEPPRLSLAERIVQAKADVSYYRDQLKDTSRWTLNDLSFFEYRLEETTKELAKLKKRQHWQKKSRQEKTTIDIEALKQGHDLIEVVQSYGLSPFKSGKEYMCRCPFHEDKTPSLSINPQKQVFHCFGCQESGDLIDFIMKLEACDFLAAIEVLR